MALNAGRLPIAQIEDLIRAEMALHQIPSAAISISLAGTVAYSRGFGDYDDRTVFPIASVSKQFTAAGILYLAERGQLSLSDSVRKYFPNLDFDESICIHHLLNHTSGIPGYTELEQFDLLRYTAASADEVVSLVSGLPPAFVPGAEMQYCNTNYVMLASIIEMVAGESYADFFKRIAFDPLGLAHTGCSCSDGIPADSARGYTCYSLGPIEPAKSWSPIWAFGAGSLFSTVHDLAVWNAALRSGRVVSGASFASMMTPGVLNDGTRSNYGYGLRSEDVSGLRQVRHSGGLPGFSLGNITYPDLGLDVVILTNLDGIDPYLSIARPVVAVILDKPEFARSERPVNGPAMAYRDRRRITSWLDAAKSKRFGDLRLTPSFERFLDRAKRRRISDVFEGVPLDAALLLGCVRQEPLTSFQFKSEFRGEAVAVALTVTDRGETRFLDVRPWGGRQFTQP